MRQLYCIGLMLRLIVKESMQDESIIVHRRCRESDLTNLDIILL